MRRRIEIHPRLLTTRQAADYCGISLSAFLRVCPVRPISMGPDERLIRYDIKRLDVWLDSLGPEATADDVGRDLGDDREINWNR